MSKLFSIGEVSKLKGTTVKTLRFYDKIGLVKPVYVDPNTNYRYYSSDQFLLIEQILSFRASGASLKEISQSLKSNNSVELAEFAITQIQQAQQKIELLEDFIDRNRQLIAHIYHDKARSVNFEPYYRWIPSRSVLTRPCKTTPTHSDTLKIYSEVYQYIRQNNLSTIYATGSFINFDMETLEISYEKMFVEVKHTERSKKVTLASLPGGEYLCVNYYAATKEAQLQKIKAELIAQDYEPKLFFEADTFLYMTDYSNPMMELQILI